MARLPFLVVEDGTAIAHELRSILPRFRPTQIAASADDGYLAIASEKRWAGIAIEIGADGKAGLELLAFVREHSAMPAIVVAGPLDPASINRIARLRASYVCAPLDEETMRPFAQRVGIVEHGLEETIGDEIEQEASVFALTPREAEILTAVVARRGHKEMASYFGISANTLKTAIRRMLKKFRKPNLEEVAMRITARIRARKTAAPPADYATAQRLLLRSVDDAKNAADGVRDVHL